MENTLTKRISANHLAEVEDQLTVAFKEIGFGVLNTLDFQAILQEKIQKDIGNYKLLQICNPGLAHEAIQQAPSIGLQLPCNVLIRKEHDAFIVEVQSPKDSIPENAGADLKQMAEALNSKIQKLLDDIA